MQRASDVFFALFGDGARVWRKQGLGLNSHRMAPSASMRFSQNCWGAQDIDWRLAVAAVLDGRNLDHSSRVCFGRPFIMTQERASDWWGL